ncbi:MAG: helix-turn-helix transcriptional regulator [Desulfobacteraceae bacterium]|nr:helix-turn-helix transcriptional regulator [Desulfobacteraceae bacterium]
MGTDKFTHKKIGNRLRAFRSILEMSQKDFALMNNFNATQYTNWETGARRIPIQSAAQLEERYGLTLDFIYLGRLRTLPHNLAADLSESPLLN